MILTRLGQARRVSTQTLPIGGGRDYPADPATWAQTVAAETGASTKRAATLLARYGTTAWAVLAAEGAAPQPLTDAPDYSAQELDWLTRNEAVQHLDDLLMRRTALAITGQLTAQGLAQTADVAAAALGWDAARREREVQATRAALETRHRLRLR